MSTALRLSRNIEPAHAIVVGLLVLLAAIGSTVSSQFATTENLANLLSQAAALGFVSLGQTLVVLAGGVDLSMGALVSFLAVLFAVGCERWPEHTLEIFALTLAGGALVGTVNAVLTEKLKLHSLVVTIGMAAVLNGATLLVTRQPAGQSPNWVQDLAYGNLAGVSRSAWIMVAFFALAGTWLRLTRSGLRLYAVGGNPESARLTGLNPARSTLLVFSMSGACAAAAALYLVARSGTGDPLAGDPLTLASLTPVVIGGTLLGGGKGGVLGTFLGMLLFTLLGNVLNYMNVSTFVQWTAQGVIIITAVFFQAGSRGAR
jgi:ribose transport system permease protein